MNNRSFDRSNTCSSLCEGRGPIRRVAGKPPTGYAVNNTTAEALRRTATEVRGPIQLSWTVHPVHLFGPHVSLCAARGPHADPAFKLVVIRCRLFLQTGVAKCSVTVFLTNWDCSGLLPTSAPSSECGDMLQIHSCVFLCLNPVAATTKPQLRPQWGPESCR